MFTHCALNADDVYSLTLSFTRSFSAFPYTIFFTLWKIYSNLSHCIVTFEYDSTVGRFFAFPLSHSCALSLSPAVFVYLFFSFCHLHSCHVNRMLWIKNAGYYLNISYCWVLCMCIHTEHTKHSKCDCEARKYQH